MQANAGICQPKDSKVASSLSDKAPEVLRAYFNEFPNTFLTQHHIQSYESFLFQEMPDIIFAENPITILKEPLPPLRAKGAQPNDPPIANLYAYKVEIYIGGNVDKKESLAIDVGNPSITLDNGRTVRRMFPNEATIRDLTYAATFQADISIHITFTEEFPGKQFTTRTEVLEVPKYPLFRIPILLRSKLCATYQASPSLLYEMGECRNDQGGYFIVDGSEKVLITRQEQAFNSVYVTKMPASNLKVDTYASVICLHPETKQTRRVSLYRLHETSKSAMFGKSKEEGLELGKRRKLIEEGVIRVSIPFVKGAIPVFVLFRALGVESDEEIVRMILPDVDSPLHSAMEATLLPSIYDAWPITTQVLAIEFLKTLTKGFLVAHVLNIMREHLFSHVPNRPFAKAQYLAELIRKMIRVEMNLEPPTNRDDIRNQRLLPTGVLLRGLFQESWKSWKKAVRKSVDTKYNYNKILFQGPKFKDIFAQGNINSVLSSTELNGAILRGFRGKWGTNQYNMKTGVIQPLARISYLDAMSHTRRVVSDFDTSMKLVGPRQLNPSQVGYFCTAETPTGGHIGATKNLSILTAVSIPCPVAPFVNWLFQKGGVQEIGLATTSMRATATSVQVNGGTIGFTNQPTELSFVLKLLKWTACFPPTCSIAFNTSENILRIYFDDGRPLRPLWHIVGETPVYNGESWRDLVCGSFPPTADKGIYSTEFVDPLADIPDATLLEYQKALLPHIGKIEYMDPYEGNEAYISWWGANLEPTHTHVEVHPSSLMGLMGNMIPFSNHNQSPRNQLSCSQSKQGIGYYATNYENRFDTYGSMLCYGEGPICRTILYDAVADGAMPYGANIIFCINSFNGYNQDDGILMNRSSIERGMFRSLSLRSYAGLEEDDPITKAQYRIGNPKKIAAWSDLRIGADYSQLDETGIIRENTVIHEKSVLVGRYFRDPETGEIKDASLMPTVFTQGRVDKVVVLHLANGLRLVRIRILEERIPELGDKFSSRHGQKGTIGMLLDAQDMPRTKDGLVPDVMVNPHCIPSRMTIAQLLEQVFGKFGANVGSKMNATTFMNNEESYHAIAEALESMGIQREGEEILYSGITGTMFTSSVFMGPLYFMRIKHLVQDKLNARGKGRKEIRTHQPTGGRGAEGGMRIGEMERDALIAHGVTDFFQESMMKRSDAAEMWICNGCGTLPIFNESQALFVCPMCDGPLTFQGDTEEDLTLVLPVKKSRVTFSKVHIPYAMKLLDQELITYMNGGFRFLTEKTARQFREPTDMALEDLLDVGAKEDLTGVHVRISEPLVPLPEGDDEREAPKEEPKEDKPKKKRGSRKAKQTAAEAEEDEGQQSPSDTIDDGQPAKNDTGAIPPEGANVIEFNLKSKQYREFDNSYEIGLELDGKEWPTVEHAYQASKYPDRPDIQERIRLAKTGGSAKTIGRTEEAHARPDWESQRLEILEGLLRRKFSDAYPKLKAKLRNTKDAILRFDAPQDNFFGIGRKKKGLNHLGEILMKLRADMQEGGASPTVQEDINEIVHEDLMPLEDVKIIRLQ
jgi:DNA-directed RNA polymerase II subunit RPB2